MHPGRAAWTVQRHRRVRTRALCLPSRGGGHGARVRTAGCGAENLVCSALAAASLAAAPSPPPSPPPPSLLAAVVVAAAVAATVATGGRPRGRRSASVGAGAGIGVGSRPRALMSVIVGADALQDSRCRAARVCHDRGAGLSPCARNTTIREAISRDTSSSQHAACTGHAARRNRTRSAAGTFSGQAPAFARARDVYTGIEVGGSNWRKSLLRLIRHSYLPRRRPSAPRAAGRRLRCPRHRIR